jgi:voltage-gated potassium channel
LIGQELRSTPIRAELDVVIVSIRKQGGEVLFNPSADAVIDGGDILIAIGRTDSLTRLNQLARGMV